MKTGNCFKSQLAFYFLQKAWHKRTGGREYYSDCSQTQETQEKGVKVRSFYLTQTYTSLHVLWQQQCQGSSFPVSLTALAVLPTRPCRPWQGVARICWDPEAQDLRSHGKCSQKGWNLGQMCSLISSCSESCGQLQMISSLLHFRLSALKVCQHCPGFPRMLLNCWPFPGY